MHTFPIIDNINRRKLFSFFFFVENLLKNDSSDKDICVFINSQGGDHGFSVQIINRLQELREKGYSIHTHASCLCASSALLLFLAGDDGKRTAGYYTKFLFHRTLKHYNFQFVIKEDTDINEVTKLEEIKKTQESMKKNNPFIFDYYTEKTKLTKELFLEWEDKSFDVHQAMKWGMVNAISSELYGFDEITQFVKEINNLDNQIPSFLSKKKHDKTIEIRNHYQKGIISEKEFENLCIDLLANKNL